MRRGALLSICSLQFPLSLFGRGTHYHTQHPLELTNCLNGYDEEGKTENRERWAIALKSWEDRARGRRQSERRRDSFVNLAGLPGLVVGTKAELRRMDSFG